MPMKFVNKSCLEFVEEHGHGDNFSQKLQNLLVRKAGLVPRVIPRGRRVKYDLKNMKLHETRNFDTRTFKGKGNHHHSVMAACCRQAKRHGYKVQFSYGGFTVSVTRIG